jgi:uncharacterized damage-inducible protein DinB
VNVASYFRAQACNNAHANHRLLSACAQLDAGELAARRTGFFPSIIHTLNHILTVDWYYVSALEGACIGPSAFDPEIPHRGFAGLERAQRDVDARLIAHCEDLDEAALAGRVVMDRGSWEQVERRDRTLLHLFQHQIHHRGQVHAMLSGTRVPPPQLDEFFLDHERERVLRVDDFRALGFSEARIWR